MYRILIVEDDPVIAGSIERYICSWGWEARCAEDFSDITAQFEVFAPQLVLMDISLPFYNGYYWCSEIRKTSKVPIIFISSASDNMNIVMAMDMGGDDFIAKPFDLAVLAAKIRAVLRRSYDFAPSVSVLECAGASLNLSDGTLRFEGQKIELTKNEHRILQLLFENKGHTVGRETIMMKLWESDSFIDENTLSVNVARLRKKLESAGLPGLIHTKKGEGYMVEAE